MDPLLILLGLWVLYGLVMALRRLLAARRRVSTTTPARPPGRARAPGRPRPSASAVPGEVPRRIEREPRPPAPERAAATSASDWRRRLARPERLREAIVAAEILRRPGRARRPAR